LKIPDILATASNPSVSFEITPPPHGKRASTLNKTLDALAAFKPLFIDVTSRAAKMSYKSAGEGAGFKQHILQPTPGTLPICSKIQEKYGVSSAPHALCRGFTPKESQTFLIDAYFGADIDNVLVVRGDDLNYDKEYAETPNRYAVDLVRQIVALNGGEYLNGIRDTATDFCIGVAGYPEKHIEAANFKTDLKFLKEKIDAGADYIVTQMFFNNQKFYQFVEECRNIGITCPIIPGIKILTSRRHLAKLPERFHLDIPYDLSETILSAEKKPGTVTQIGVDWATAQVQDLFSKPQYFVGGNCIVHFYITGGAGPVKRVLAAVNL
jgi:methylenetetrahydrofolate reductase (NADPH)